MYNMPNILSGHELWHYACGHELHAPVYNFNYMFACFGWKLATKLLIKFCIKFMDGLYTLYMNDKQLDKFCCHFLAQNF